jgi:hypothetical protein
MRAGISKAGSFAFVLVVGVLVIATVLAFSRENRTSTGAVSSSTTNTTSDVNPSMSNTSSVTGTCGPGIQTIALNGTAFCAHDVANDTVLGGPGYSYFRNGSITFIGVTFRTICPSNDMGCPGANSTAATVTLGIMSFTMTFPDKTNVTASAPIGDDTYIPILSNHSNPRAGMLIEITNEAQGSTARVFLLVEEP